MGDTMRRWNAPEAADRIAAWLALKDRALDVAAEGITIADARLPDRPLIYVNDGFERMTGYPVAEALGRNCRFLQGPDTDPGAMTEIRAALREDRECLAEILNYRKDGTPFWNRLSITPVRDSAGEVTHFIRAGCERARRGRLAAGGRASELVRLLRRRHLGPHPSAQVARRMRRNARRPSPAGASA